jgi:hypothetical protein
MLRLKVLSGALAAVFAMVLGVAAGSGCACSKHEVKVAVEDVPAAVKDVAQKVVPGIVLTRAEKKTRGAKVVYEFDGKVGDKQYEIKVAEDGTLIKVELEDRDDQHATKDVKKGNK